MWSWNDQFSDVLVEMVEKMVNFMMMYFYELREAESIEAGLKMTNFENHLGKLTHRMKWNSERIQRR